MSDPSDGAIASNWAEAGVRGFRNHFREADWLHAERARAWCRVLGLGTAVVVLAVVGWLLWTGGRVVDPMGRPLGTDFVSFYAASDVALAGRPTEAYELASHRAAQQRAVGPIDSYFAFFYPPTFLLLVLPLATLPYLAALALWLCGTGYAYWRALRALAGNAVPLTTAFAYPAVIVNAGHGQNALLSAALFGFASAYLDRRPRTSGICIGLLCYKPHLAIMAPVALAAAGRWQAFFWAAGTVVGLVLVSIAALGAETWTAFLAQAPLAAQALEQNLVGAEKMASSFAAVQLLGGATTLAYAVQITVAASVAVVLVRAARVASGPSLGAMLVTASALASPFLLDYDLAILAVPLAHVFVTARRAGRFPPWSKMVLLVVFLLPLLARTFALYFSVPLAPIAMLALFAVILRQERDGGAHPAPEPCS